MENEINRRRFLKSSKLIPALVASGVALKSGPGFSQTKVKRTGGAKLKVSCNLYSFNRLLRSGQMTLEEVVEFCARLDFEAVDPTAYYFPGYPDTPDDSYLYSIKRKAFLLGLDISGTGVRNDFTTADENKRKADIALVKKWIECAARLGAPVLRVFAGRGVPEGYRQEQVDDGVAGSIKECAEYGGQYGVMVVLQNHAEFIKTAEHTLKILRMVDSEWSGVNLDIGSFRTADPYEDIAKVAPYAVTWQIKENLTMQAKEVKTDLKKIVRILRNADYRGYIPIETLGAGDPREKVPKFLDEVRAALA